MKGPTSFRAVIDLWPTRSELAKRLGFGGKGQPICGAHVRVWRQRNRIHPRHFDRLILAAQACGFTSVTYPLLARLTPGLDPNGNPWPPKSAG